MDEESCTGCGVCVEECPVDTIYMREDIAFIDMDGCIRCGVCHDVCPEEAVRHDSERIPQEVEANIAQTREYMDACAVQLGDEREKQKCLGRMIKHFNKERIVAEKTLEALQALKEK